MKKISIGTLGNTLVGKTALSRCYSGEEFEPNEIVTTGMGKFMKNIELKIKEKTINLNVIIHDTAGQEKYQAIALNYIRKCDGILLVYTVDDRRSLIDVEKWLTKIKETNQEENYPLVLLGNKIDLFKENNSDFVTKKEGEELAQKYNFKLFETSAKTKENVEEAFQYMIDLIVKNKEKELLGEKKKIVIGAEEDNKNDKTQKKKKNCC